MNKPSKRALSLGLAVSVLLVGVAAFAQQKATNTETKTFSVEHLGTQHLPTNVACNVRVSQTTPKAACVQLGYRDAIAGAQLTCDHTGPNVYWLAFTGTCERPRQASTN